MSDRKTAWMVGAAYLALLLVWAWRFTGHAPVMMDTLAYVFPEKWVDVQAYRAGNIPLWNPWVACGLPHVGDLQSAAFYPPFWLWILTGLPDWFFWMALAHGLLAALGFFLWARQGGAREPLAALTAVGFAGSALLVFYWGFPTHLATVAWVPWIFWATARFNARPSWMGWALLTLFWSLDFLAGYIYITFYAALLWAAWTWGILRPGLPKTAAYGASSLAAWGLTACQWLPFLDFIGHSQRPGVLDAVYSLHAVNFLTLLSPDILGFPGTASYRGDFPDYIFNNFYLGWVPLALWLAGWLWARGGADRFWRWAGLVVLLWTAGTHFPLWHLLPAALLGTLDPAKAAFLFVFCAFTALVFWIEPLLRRKSVGKKARRWITVLGVLWLLDLLLVPFRVMHLMPDPYRDPQMARVASLVGQAVGQGRMVSLHRGDLPSAFPGAGPADSIRDHLLELPPNSNLVFGIRSAAGYFSIFPDGYQDLQAYLNRGFPFEGRILDAAGVDALLTQDELSPFKYRLLGDWGPYRLSSNAGALPLLWLDYRVREFPDRPSVFGALLKPDAFLENELYTEKSPDGHAVRLPPPGRSLPYGAPGLLDRWSGFWDRLGGSKLSTDARSPCRLGVEVNLRDPGYVVWSQTFSPGWRAWVDGEPKPILRADGLFMAVVVPQPGLHRVDFRYEPTAFRLGLFVSLLSVVLLGLVLPMGLLRRR
ncbi:MAG TPA: YfhO family protein [bacterium]|nr:YfhO family protein [bacterium]